MNFIGEYFKGMSIFFKGWALFWENKSLRRLAFIPLIISFLVLIAGLVMGWQLVPSAMALITPYLGDFFQGFLLFLVTAIFHIIYFALLVVFLFLFANILAIPFNALIAERAMILSGADFFQPKSKREWLKYNMQMLTTGLLKTFVVICLGVAMFFLSFFPVLSAMATFFGVFVLAFDSCDYALELKNKNLKNRWQFVKENFWQLCGYTTVMSVSFLIPGLNFFLLPVFITSGTIFVAHREKN